jgi:hypothetical protein
MIFYSKRSKMEPDIRKHRKKSYFRMETREYYQCGKIGWMEEKGRWKGLKSIVMVSKRVKEKVDFWAHFTKGLQIPLNNKYMFEFQN